MENLTEPLVPIIPIDEQKRIAGILDHVDELRNKRHLSIDLINSFSQSIFIEIFGDPIINPKKWNKKKLSEIVPIIESGWSPVCESRPATSEEKGVLKLGAVTWCEYNENENKAFLSDGEFDSKIEVRVGDLLFCRKNTLDLVAGTSFVFNTRPGLMMSDLIFRINPSVESGVNSIYLWRLLTNSNVKKQIQSLAGGSAGSMPNISKEKLKNFWILVPPRELQENFAKQIIHLNNLKSKFDHYQESLNSIFVSIQQQAFAGEL